MHERLQLLIKEYRLTSSRFAEILGIQPSAVSHIISGRNKPGFELLSKILVNFPEINPRWLMLGEEPLLLEGLSGSRISQPGLNDSLTEPLRVPDKIIPPQPDSILPGLDSDESKPQTGTVVPPPAISKAPATQSVDPEYSTSPQNREIAASRSAIEKIIILYTDGTFDTFNPK